MERDFKGVWIPKEIWLDTRLNALDKIILVEINSLDGEDGCFASNEYLAEFCQCSEAKVSKSVALLIKLGYLEVLRFDGRKRFLKSSLVKNTSHVKNTSEPSKIYEADSENLQDNNIYNNIDNNTIPKGIEEAEPRTAYGNENINRMYDLWEDMFGYRPKNSLENRRAVYNMLRAKDKGEQWLVDTMRLLQGAQNDKYAGKDINGISNFKELSYNCEKVWKWGSSRARQVKSSIESIKI